MKISSFRCDMCGSSMAEPYEPLTIGRIEYDLCTVCYTKLNRTLKEQRQRNEMK